MKTIIFDIDGTLVDTSPLVIPAMHRAIGKFPRIPQPSEEAIKDTFGMPDPKIFETLMPDAAEEDRREAWAIRDQYMSMRMGDTNVLLPHAYTVLQTLKSRGYTLTTASNCDVPYLNDVLDSQGIRGFFTEPLCLGSVRGKRKADILTAHFRRFNKSDAILVGDRSSDVEAARFHGIPVIGCAFGFGNEAEIADADARITSLLELLDLFPEV